MSKRVRFHPNNSPVDDVVDGIFLSDLHMFWHKFGEANLILHDRTLLTHVFTHAWQRRPEQVDDLVDFALALIKNGAVYSRHGMQLFLVKHPRAFKRLHDERVSIFRFSPNRTHSFSIVPHPIRPNHRIAAMTTARQHYYYYHYHEQWARNAYKLYTLLLSLRRQESPDAVQLLFLPPVAKRIHNEIGFTNSS
jgi:hypothetical protein